MPDTHAAYNPHVGLLAALLAVGCGADARPATGAPTTSDGGVIVVMHHARRVEGTLGGPVAADLLFGLFTVPVSVNGDEGPPFLVDTGAPLTFVTPALHPLVGAGLHDVASLRVGAVTLRDVPVVGADPFGLGTAVGGVLGVNLICQFASTWDWRGRRFFLGAPPTDVETDGDALTQPFRLVGGGLAALGGGVTVPVAATRLLVEARVEGAARTLVLDTGASTSVLSDDLVEALARDGRGSVQLDVAAQGGVMHQRTLRAREIQALGVTRVGAVITGYDAAALAQIGAEVGRRVDGLLGAEFLHEFLTTIDYPRGEVVLRRYRGGSGLPDPWTRVGVFLRSLDGRTWTVAQVIPGTDAAAQGVPVEATVLTVDGRALAGLARDDVDGLLRGEAGATRTVATADRSYTLRVEDVLPLRGP